MIHKAVIPVAGLGTRLYPITRSIGKEFIPVIDTDGLVKPVILIILEQLYNSGIDEICLIVSCDEDIKTYKKFFQTPISEEYNKKLSNQMHRFEKKIFDIGKKLSFRVPKENKGFGYSVLQAADFCDGEPVLLLLGDTIYRSKSQKTCSKQIIEAYEKLKRPIVSIHETKLNDVIHYGILSGTWDDKNKTLMNVTEFIEKPTVEYAKKFLGVKRDNDKFSYYSVFGQYILTPEVFLALDDNIKSGKAIEKNGEIGLTAVLASFINSSTNNGASGLYGVVLSGKMFDTGNAQAYMETLRKYNR